MSKKLSRFFQLLIVGIWLCLVSVLLYKNYISGVEFTPLQSVTGEQFRTSEEWFGIYFQDKKIGHMKISSEKIGDEYRFIKLVETDVERDGKNHHRSELFKCLTDLEYRMKTFEFKAEFEGVLLKARGELDENNILLVFMEGGGQKKTYTQEMHKKFYFPITFKRVLFEKELEKGKRFNVPLFNISTMKAEDIVVEVQELIPVKLGINVNTAYRLNMGGNILWMSSNGHTLKEKAPSGLTYYAETETAAKSKEKKEIFDFLSLPVIQSEKQLSHPEELSSVKIRLSGLNLSEYPLLNEGRQVIRGDIIEISKETIDLMKEQNYDLPYQGNGLEDFLTPTPFVQSDHHTVIYYAKKYIELETTAFRLARFLTGNLYLTINKMPVFHFNTSMDIFKTHAGESNEHTVMFTSFARAGGLPTRMVGGLVYLKGHFYYHTWPEIWLKQWVPVDPTMGQFPADATHIRLMEGDIDELASLGKVIGNIKIDIMGEL